MMRDSFNYHSSELLCNIQRVLDVWGKNIWICFRYRVTTSRPLQKILISTIKHLTFITCNPDPLHSMVGTSAD